MSELDIVRVQDAGLSGADDPTVLEWTAQEGRILLTRDVATMTRYALERVRGGRGMPGLFGVDPFAPVGRIIDDVLLLVSCGLPDEWEGRGGYLPL